MTPEERKSIVDEIIADLRAGPNGLPVLPVPKADPAPPSYFWVVVWPKAERFVTPILVAASTAIVLWINSLNHADTTAKVEAGTKQAQENGAEIKAAHKTVSRIVGAAVTE